MEAKNIADVLEEMSFSSLRVDKKWLMSICVCILTEDQSHPYVNNIDQHAANYLSSFFCDTNVERFWRYHSQSDMQSNILYGLLYMIGSNSKEVVRVEARACLYRVLQHEIKANRSNCGFTLLRMMKDETKARCIFENETKDWLGERNVKLKVDSLIQGLSILLSLMEFEFEQAGDDDKLLHTCQMIGYFILVNDNEPKLLLKLLMEKVEVVFGPSGDGEDRLWKWLKCVLEEGGLVGEGETELIQELTECFVNYSCNKRVIVSALLLRFVLLDTPYKVQVNSMIVAIEKAIRNGRFWGTNACLADRLMLILEEQRELAMTVGGNDKKIKSVLETIYSVLSNLGRRFGLLSSDEGLSSNVTSMITELLACLNDLHDEDATVFILRCLIIYMNRQYYTLDYWDYINVYTKLQKFHFAEEIRAQLLKELNEVVDRNIEETSP